MRMNLSIRKLILIVFVLAAVSPSASSAEKKERVINGSAVTVDYPWMASLGTTDLDPGRGHFCGAIIIDSHYALTAAHCTEGLINTPESIQVFVGKSNLTDKSAKIVSVTGMIVHPDFDPDTQQNDLALIRLGEALDPSFVAPVLTVEEEAQLPTGISVLLLGWGTTDPNISVRPSILQQAQIPLIDGATCQSRIGIDFDPNSMLCGGTLSSAAQKGDGVDACYGDSGGPILVQTPQGVKLLGLSSWGFSCASEKYWGVYTRVPPFSEWIKSARTVSPYLVSAPALDGIPRAGSKISCDTGVFGGDKATSKSVSIQDSDTGQILKNGSSYELKRSDTGRNIVCVVNVGNAGGELTAQSDVLGPVFPMSSTAAVKFTGGSVSNAGINCSNSKCALLLTFKKAQVSLRSLLAGSSNRSTSWKRAVKQTPHAWIVSLPSNWRSYRGILVRSVGTDKRSYLSEARF